MQTKEVPRMGIHDRKYMSGEGKRHSFGGGMPKTFTVKFVFVVAAVLLADLLFDHEITRALIFDVGKIKSDWEVWRIFSSFFLSNPGGNIVVTLVVLYVFYSLGNALENELGTTKFINLLISMSIGMALVGLIMPSTYDLKVAMKGGAEMTVKAPVVFGYVDGMLSGLFLAYGLFLGRQKMTLLLMFLVPVSLSGYALIGFTVGIIFLSAFAFNSIIALPMLGGCLGAYLFITQYSKGNHIDYFKILAKAKGKPKPKQKPVSKPRMNTNQQNFQIMDEPEEDVDDVDKYIKEKVDPILEKIATSGMNSLTAKEKKILENAKKKMGK
jgi:membrane associated rhomboid family serine protease